MSEQIPEDEEPNYEIFRECVSVPVLKALALPVQKPKKKPRKKKEGRGYGKTKSRGGGEKQSEATVNGESGKEKEVIEKENNKGEDLGNGDDAEDLGEFIDYLSTLLFTSLPPPLRRMSPSAYDTTPSLRNLYALPLSGPTTTHLIYTLSPVALSTMESYLLLPSPPSTTELELFFTPVLSSYLTSTIIAPPVPIWSSTRTSACELCQREWIPLTYHHLIPQSTHAKVMKRGWHEERDLGSVAWLCRACHSFVHRILSNEELAKSWYSIELLEQREDVRKWIGWVGRVRWKAR